MLLSSSNPLSNKSQFGCAADVANPLFVHHDNPARSGGYRESHHGHSADILDDVSMRSESPLLEDAEMLSDSQVFQHSQQATKALDADRHKHMQFPKLKDIGFDKIQSKSVFQHSENLQATDHAHVNYHFSNVARSTQDSVSSPAKRRLLGFDAQELLLNGALNCFPCRPCNLIYDPRLNIFREENFLDTPQDVLEVLKPALALAEQVLLHGNPRFWVDIACGTRVPDDRRTKQTTTYVERLLPVADITETVQVEALSRLQKFGKLTTFRFHPLKDQYGRAVHPTFMPCSKPANGSDSYGRIRPADQPLPRHAAVPANPWEQQGVIIIDNKFYSAAKTFSRQKFVDVAAQLRFTFFFAVNLLHEIAHSFDSKCGGGHYYDLITQDRSKPGSWSRSYQSRIHEPTYKQYEDHEMGLYMEYETFGGRVHPINIDFSARYGLNVYLGNAQAKPSKAGIQATDEGQPYSWAIPMGYIEELHQQSFWAKEPSDGRLMIPRQGVHAYGLNSMSTVAWRHHLLGNDTAYTFEEMDISFDDQAHLAKKQKLELPDSNSRSQKSPRRRQLVQTKIRTYPSKAEAAAADMKTMLIAQASMNDMASSGTEFAQPVSSYIPPPAHQPAIDETFCYLNSEDHLYNFDPQLEQTSDSYDPLIKQPHELTIFDKWLLVEDYALLTTDWTSSTFLAKRALLDSYSRKSSKASSSPVRKFEGDIEDKHWPLHPVPQRLIPDYDNPDNWNQKDFRFLRYLRKSNPTKGLLVDRKKRREEREARVRLWKVRSEMEELVVRKGGSRVAWLAGGEQAKKEEDRLGLKELRACEGDADAWEEKWRPILLKLREEQNEKEVLVTPSPEDDTEKIESRDETQNAITQYFNLTTTQRVLRDMEDEEEKKLEVTTSESEAPSEPQPPLESESDPASKRRSWRRQTPHLSKEQAERERERQEREVEGTTNKDSDGDEILDDKPLEQIPISFIKRNQELSTSTNTESRERKASVATTDGDVEESDDGWLDQDGDEVLNDEPGSLAGSTSESQPSDGGEKKSILETSRDNPTERVSKAEDSGDEIS
jgi:hypothetical protein